VKLENVGVLLWLVLNNKTISRYVAKLFVTKLHHRIGMSYYWRRKWKWFCLETFHRGCVVSMQFSGRPRSSWRQRLHADRAGHTADASQNHRHRRSSFSLQKPQFQVSTTRLCQLVRAKRSNIAQNTCDCCFSGMNRRTCWTRKWRGKRSLLEWVNAAVRPVESFRDSQGFMIPL